MLTAADEHVHQECHEVFTGLIDGCPNDVMMMLDELGGLDGCSEASCRSVVVVQGWSVVV